MEEIAQTSLPQFPVQQGKKDQVVPRYTWNIHKLPFFHLVHSDVPFVKIRLEGRSSTGTKLLWCWVLRPCFNIQPWRLPPGSWPCREKDLTAKNTFTFYKEQHHLMLHSSCMIEKRATPHFLSGWAKIKRGKSNLRLCSPIFSTAVNLLMHRLELHHLFHISLSPPHPVAVKLVKHPLVSYLFIL